MSDPIRWLESEETPSALRTLLASAEEDSPSEKQLLALSVALGPFIGPGGGGGGAGPAGGGAAGGAGSVASTAGAVKLALALAASTLVAGGAYQLSQSSTPPPAPVVVAVAQSAPPSSVEPAADPEPLPEPSPTLVAKPPAPPRPAPKPKEVQPVSPEVTKPTTPPPPPKPPAGDAELQLLDDALEALQQGKPAEALSMLDARSAELAGGPMVQEREVLSIQALVALGRAADAKSRARRFRSNFPASTHLVRVEAMVGGLEEP